jgi:MFS family permease
MNVTVPTTVAACTIHAVSAAPAAIHLSTRRKALAFGIMCLGCFIAYLDIQIVSASLQEIGGGLSASQDELSWIQSSYLIAEIIVIPLSAWLSRVMSTRWLIAASAAGFTLASVLCSTAWDMQSMIVFRALQGFFGGSRRLSRPPSSCFRASRSHRRVLRQRRRRSCADARSGRRRLAYGWLVVALVVLRQHRARHPGHAIGSHPGQSRRA